MFCHAKSPDVLASLRDLVIESSRLCSSKLAQIGHVECVPDVSVGILLERVEIESAAYKWCFLVTSL